VPELDDEELELELEEDDEELELELEEDDEELELEEDDEELELDEEDEELELLLEVVQPSVGAQTHFGVTFPHHQVGAVLTGQDPAMEATLHM
jgi:hypothetical protein